MSGWSDEELYGEYKSPYPQEETDRLLAEINARHNAVDITGYVSGRLTILRVVKRTDKHEYLWEARCTCGNVTHVSSPDFMDGAVMSCGCLGREVRSKMLQARNVSKNGVPKRIGPRSCAKHLPESVLLIGKKIGLLSVIEIDHGKVYARKDSGRPKIHVYYKCRCKCGNTVVMRGATMTRDRTGIKAKLSCGCARRTLVQS